MKGVVLSTQIKNDTNTRTEETRERYLLEYNCVLNGGKSRIGPRPSHFRKSIYTQRYTEFGDTIEH